MESCRNFEGVFVSILLKSMRSTVGKDSLFGNDPANEIYDDMFDQNLGDKLSFAGGIGIASEVYDQLKDYLKAADKDFNGGVENAIG